MPPSTSANALLLRPLIALLHASLTVIVSVPVLPTPTGDDANAALDTAPLTAPGVTVTVGAAARLTPATVAVSVLAEPAILPVKRATYVPGVAVAATVLNVPALLPLARTNANALAVR